MPGGGGGVASRGVPLSRSIFATNDVNIGSTGRILAIGGNGGIGGSHGQTTGAGGTGGQAVAAGGEASLVHPRAARRVSRAIPRLLLAHRMEQGQVRVVPQGF